MRKFNFTYTDSHHKYLRSNIPFESLPSWIKNAKTEMAIVEMKGTEIIWHSGDWIEGTFRGYLWKNGTFREGEFKGVTWIDGTWKNGIWFGHSWCKGTWYNGVFASGCWLSGEWYDGLFGCGVTEVMDYEKFKEDVIGEPTELPDLIRIKDSPLQEELKPMLQGFESFKKMYGAVWKSGFFYGGIVVRAAWFGGVCENSLWISGLKLKGEFTNVIDLNKRNIQYDTGEMKRGITVTAMSVCRIYNTTEYWINIAEKYKKLLKKYEIYGYPEFDAFYTSILRVKNHNEEVKKNEKTNFLKKLYQKMFNNKK